MELLGPVLRKLLFVFVWGFFFKSFLLFLFFYCKEKKLMCQGL